MSDILPWLTALDQGPPGEPDEEVVDRLETCGPPPLAEAAAIGQLARRTASLDAAYWGATLLGRLGPAAAGEVPVLVHLLAHAAHLAVRERAAWALGQIGPAALPLAESALSAAAADHSHPRLARLAQGALEALRT